MSISALDSRVFRNLFGTQDMRDIFVEDAQVREMIEVEAALARAQSEVGVIPTEAGDMITKAVRSVTIDMEKLSRDTEIVGYPVLPLVEQLVAQTSADVAKHIHWGATTQDIMDTVAMLQMKRGLTIIKAQLRELTAILAGLASKYRDTAMAGRTHLQHALPCTFGYKCAVYLSSMARHGERLDEIERRCLLAQFGGAVGTLASMGPGGHVGVRVRQVLARELDLGDPVISWHAARDNVAEVLNFLALVGGSLGKMAYDMMLMSSSEVGEVSEPFVPHRGASSTMPQKRNPISSEMILAASRTLRSKAALGLDAVVVDFERASGPWHLEWLAVPEAFVVAAGALHQASFAMGSLVVHTVAMADNLSSTRGLIVGEAVMMALAPAMGRQAAHDAVYEACKASIDSGAPLLSSLKGRADIRRHLDEHQLASLCDPSQYLGASQDMVDHVLHSVAASSLRQTDGSSRSKEWLPADDADAGKEHFMSVKEATTVDEDSQAS